MSFTKKDFENLDKRIQSISSTDVQKIVNDEGIPTTNKLEDNNKVYESKATILFIDIRKSTLLTDMSKPQSMVKIYRSFMRTCVECVRKNKGVTRQFLGDRIMGVFIDERDSEGNLINYGSENALNCARTMQTCIDFSLNKHLKSNVNGKMIECGIGIDTGKILVTKVGMYGLEDDEEKNNETDCVYVGKVTNYASKYSDIAKGEEILISESVYNDINSMHKDKFKKTINVRNGRCYTGYSTFNYYLDFSDELGSIIKPDNSLFSISENDEQLSQIVDKLDIKYKELTKLEKEMSVQKDRLDKEKELCNSRYSELEDTFYNYLEKAFCDTDHIKKMGYDFWVNCITNYYTFGKKLGQTEEKLKLSVACYLIEIYNALNLYEKAFDIMILMINNSSWVLLKKETIKWAKEHNKLHKLSFELDWKIDHCSVTEKSDWQKYREDLEKNEREN